MASLKTDNAIDLLDKICKRIDALNKSYNSQLEEAQNQKDDLEHIYLAKKLNGESSDHVNKITDDMGNIIILRRTLKDASSVTRVIFENFNRTKSFLVNMDTRYYSPKSNEFLEIGKVKADRSLRDTLSTEYCAQLKDRYQSIVVAADKMPKSSDDNQSDEEFEKTTIAKRTYGNTP